ncbi:hypothetical protein B566_EDAN016586 [Ephemera danica]|nr:hypothetical protein B566_EDAN016586 [Ephemera danica]
MLGPMSAPCSSELESVSPGLSEMANPRGEATELTPAVGGMDRPSCVRECPSGTLDSERARNLSLDTAPGTHDYNYNVHSICNCLISCITLASLAFVVFQCRDYLKLILLWLEDQDPVVIYLIFIVLFAVVSFPFTWGYIFLNLACGYLFGILKGLLAVVITATIGISIAHLIIRNYLAELALSRLFNSENAKALLHVISGPQAFKVIFFARLTPIPFGLQNTIFAVSSVSPCVYLTASMSGLLPTQLINVYLGSTLRSMEDIVIGCLLMAFVVRKARSELRTALIDTQEYAKPPIR